MVCRISYGPTSQHVLARAPGGPPTHIGIHVEQPSCLAVHFEHIPASVFNHVYQSFHAKGPPWPGKNTRRPGSHPSTSWQERQAAPASMPYSMSWQEHQVAWNTKRPGSHPSTSGAAWRSYSMSWHQAAGGLARTPGSLAPSVPWQEHQAEEAAWLPACLTARTPYSLAPSLSWQDHQVAWQEHQAAWPPAYRGKSSPVHPPGSQQVLAKSPGSLAHLNSQRVLSGKTGCQHVLARAQRAPGSLAPGTSKSTEQAAWLPGCLARQPGSQHVLAPGRLAPACLGKSTKHILARAPGSLGKSTLEEQAAWLPACLGKSTRQPSFRHVLARAPGSFQHALATGVCAKTCGQCLVFVPRHAASLFVPRRAASLVFVPRHGPAWCSWQDMGQPVFVPKLGQPGVRAKTWEGLVFVPRHGPAYCSCQDMGSLIFVPRHAPAWCSAWCSCQDMAQPGVRAKTCASLIFVPRHAPAWCSAWCSCQDMGQPGVRDQHVLATAQGGLQHVLARRTASASTPPSLAISTRFPSMPWQEHLASTPACPGNSTRRPPACFGTNNSMSWHQHHSWHQHQHFLATAPGDLPSMSWHEHQHVLASTPVCLGNSTGGLLSMSWHEHQHVLASTPACFGNSTRWPPQHVLAPTLGTHVLATARDLPRISCHEH